MRKVFAPLDEVDPGSIPFTKYVSLLNNWKFYFFHIILLEKWDFLNLLLFLKVKKMKNNTKRRLFLHRDKEVFLKRILWKSDFRKRTWWKASHRSSHSYLWKDSEVSITKAGQTCQLKIMNSEFTHLVMFLIRHKAKKETNIMELSL